MSRSSRSAWLLAATAVTVTTIIPAGRAFADAVETDKAATTVAPLTFATQPTIAGATGAAASTPTSAVAASGAVPSAYEAGKAAVANGDWTTAITQFSAAVAADPKSADSENMLAYSLRKSGDLKGAFTHYGVALKLNPSHRGALEYLGEAYLLSGKPAEAKKQLARLAKVCGKKCEQYVDLSKAIAAYKPVKK